MLGKKQVSEERKEELRGIWKYAAEGFGEIATTSKHPEVPKEQQLSIDLDNKKFFDIIGRFLHWLEGKFTYFFTRYNLFPEVGTKERKIPGTNTKVKYFTLEEQAEHALYIGEENGELRLYNYKGKLYDTRDKISKGKKGYVAYVMTLDGRLIVNEHINVGKEEYACRHSTLAGGKPVLCAGLMKVVNGKIGGEEYMDNKDGKGGCVDNSSGHYKPTSANLYNVVKKFEKLFSENAKIVCFGSLNRLIKQIPLIRKIPIPTKEESVEKFLEKMEKVGKDGVTEYNRYFEKVRRDNNRYAFKLECQATRKFLSESDDKYPGKSTALLERLIKEIVDENYSHKPTITPLYNQKELVGINITFQCKEDRNRFAKVLHLQEDSFEKEIVMSTGQAKKLVRDALLNTNDVTSALDGLKRPQRFNSITIGGVHCI